MTARVQKLLLGGLLLILGVSVFFEFLNQPDPQHVPLTYTTGVTAKAHNRQNASQTLALSAVPPKYAQPPTGSFTTPRNIFAPLFPSPNPPTKPSSKPKPQMATSPTPPGALRPTTVSPPARPTPEELAANRLKQELQQFIFLGYLTRGGERKIFLRHDQAIYIVSQGETFDGDIIIQSVEPTAVTISKPLKGTGITVEATLPLTDDKQAPAS